MILWLNIFIQFLELKNEKAGVRNCLFVCGIVQDAGVILY